MLNIIEAEQPKGVIVQFGGQTPLKLAVPLQEALAEDKNLPTEIWGTSPDSIDAAEDRERFEKILRDLDIKQPPTVLPAVLMRRSPLPRKSPTPWWSAPAMSSAVAPWKLFILTPNWIAI